MENRMGVRGYISIDKTMKEIRKLLLEKKYKEIFNIINGYLKEEVYTIDKAEKKALFFIDKN